jgi:FkbH-like protein
MSTDPRKPFYRIPNDLQVAETELNRILVIGSCLIAGLPDTIRRMHSKCDVDYILFNNVLELPKQPPAPIACYDFQVVQLPLRTVVPDSAYFRLPFDHEGDYATLLENSQERLGMSLSSILRYAREEGIPTFVSNFLVPQQNPFGRLQPRYELRNPVYFIETLNRFLDSQVRKVANCYPVDVNQIAASYGKRHIQDDAVWQTNHASALSDMDFEQDQQRLEKVTAASEVYETKVDEFVLATWIEILGMHRSIKRADAVKLVIVDLDDTLWRGILAEEGPSSVEGWPLGLAEGLLYLKRRGVILAIASKNDSQVIEANFNQVFGADRLRLEDFAVRAVNWDPKVDSVAAIIHKVNVLPNSVVFVDDNPVERAAVMQAFPGIRVIGGNLYEIRRILLWAPETQFATLTAESALRTEMIAAQVERESLRETMPRAEFLASLGVTVATFIVSSAAHPKFERVMELVNKSNQFNTTGRRWTQKEWTFGFAHGLKVLVLQVNDKFTNYGLVVAALLDANTIIQFVMSCRVIGLGVEEAAVAKINQEMIQSKAALLQALLKPSDSNFLCRDLFQKTGFHLTGDVWTKSAEPCALMPAHVREAPLERADCATNPSG